MSSGTFDRNLVQTMVAQAEGLMQRGMEQCNVASIREFLDRSAEGEQGFLQVVRQEFSHLTTVLQSLKSGSAVSGQASSEIQVVVERVAQLWSAAQQVNASHAMAFFMGLHSFLTIVSQKRVTILPKQYEAVEFRLGQSVKGVEQWAESGQRERMAIQRVLPH
jgi:aldehyde:ferredoxin oxidoreductase